MSDDQETETLARLIKDIKIAMLSTLERDGSIRSRPMATQSEPFDGHLWFFTQRDSPKVVEVNREHKVNLSYADPEHNRYVSVSGSAVQLDDPARAKSLWNPLYKAWFPKGLEDPELTLLRVDVEKAEYWDMPDGKVVQLVGFVKALVTGKTYTPGENEKLMLR